MTEEERKAFRDAMFKKGLAERKAEQNNKNYTQEYEDIAGCALSKENGSLFRIIGNPPNNREVPSDPKIIMKGYVLCDDDKKRQIIYPDVKEKNHIFWRILHKVLECDWVMQENGKKTPIYRNQNLTSIFNRVKYNNDINNKMERGWSPNISVMMNVIDRLDPDFHKQNKHTKLLSKGCFEKNDVLRFDYGINISIYNHIWNDVIEFYGDWENYDIAVIKLANDPYCQVICGSEKLKLSRMNIDPKFVVESDLTEEERNYERYDFDKLFKVTSYTKYLNNLENVIRQIDKALNTHYFEELSELSNKEKEEWEKNAKEDTNTQIIVEKEIPKDSLTSNELLKKVETPIRSSNKRVNVDVDWEGLANGSYNGTIYKGVPEMTNEEKALVINVNSDGSFEYKEEAGKLYADAESGFKSPSSFHIDPLSGNLFE